MNCERTSLLGARAPGLHVYGHTEVWAVFVCCFPSVVTSIDATFAIQLV